MGFRRVFSALGSPITSTEQMMTKRRANKMMKAVRRFGPLRLLCGLAFACSVCSAACHAQNTIQVPGQAPTIQAGIDLAADGDTVQVAPGTYNENIDFKGKAILVTSGASSFNGASSTIINSAGNGQTVTFDTNESSRAVLNGFTITGGRSNAANCSYGGGVYVKGSSPTISNNQILNNDGYGIYATGASSPLIQGNDIKGNNYSDKSLFSATTGVPGSGYGVGMNSVLAPQIIGNTIEENHASTSSSSSSTPSNGAGINVLDVQQINIAGNVLRNNTADVNAGIFIATFQTQKVTLLQNLIYGNVNPNESSTQIYIGGSAFQTSAPVLEEVNNTIYGGGQELVSYFAPSTIENNILYNPNPNPGTGVLSNGLNCAGQSAQQSPIQIQNNDIYPVSTDPMDACSIGSGNLFTDPNLVNPSQGEYHEQASSPTIDAGTLSAPDIPSADLDGTARTVCGQIDMGAYELRPVPPVSVASSANPTPGGSPLTFTAHVTGNCNEPTGTVTFLDGGKPIGTGVLNGSGTATLTTSLLVVGNHNITVSYPGDFNFQASTSPVLVQVITGDPTTTTVMVSPNPALAFSPITFSSTVSSQFGIPTGSVSFVAGGTTLATAPLNAAGVAATTVSTIGGGVYNVVANYTADTRFQPSSSAPVREVVNGANSVTLLIASPNPAAVTQNVTFSTTVKGSQGTTVPTGTVSFTSDGASIGTGTLNPGGVATISTSNLPVGSHRITANYGGSSNFDPSSASLTENIGLIGTGVALTASPNPANTGQTVTLTAQINAAVAGMVPFGTITFLDGTTTLGTAALNDQGAATFTTSSLSDGSHALTAVYAANAYFAGGTSPVVNEVVQAYDFSIGTSKSSISLPSGDYTMLNVTVTPIGGFSGSVNLSCAGVPDHSQCTFPQGSEIALASGAKTVQVAVNTSDVYGYGKLVQSAQNTPALGSRLKGWLALAFLPDLGILGCSRRSRLNSMQVGGLILIVAAMLFSLQACSGKLPGKTLPGKYNLQLTGTANGSSSLQHSSPLQLVVTPSSGE